MKQPCMAPSSQSAVSHGGGQGACSVWPSGNVSPLSFTQSIIRRSDSRSVLCDSSPWAVTAAHFRKVMDVGRAWLRSWLFAAKWVTLSAFLFPVGAWVPHPEWPAPRADPRALPCSWWSPCSDCSASPCLSWLWQCWGPELLRKRVNALPDSLTCLWWAPSWAHRRPLSIQTAKPISALTPRADLRHRHLSLASRWVLSELHSWWQTHRSLVFM